MQAGNGTFWTEFAVCFLPDGGEFNFNNLGITEKPMIFKFL